MQHAQPIGLAGSASSLTMLAPQAMTSLRQAQQQPFSLGGAAVAFNGPMGGPKPSLSLLEHQQQQAMHHRHRFQCTMCTLTCPSVDELHRHMQEAHVAQLQLLAARQAVAAAAAPLSAGGSINAKVAAAGQKYMPQASPLQNGESQHHQQQHHMINGGSAAANYLLNNFSPQNAAGLQQQQSQPPLSNFASPKTHFVSPKQQILQQQQSVPANHQLAKQIDQQMASLLQQQQNQQHQQMLSSRYGDIDETTLAAANAMLSISGARKMASAVQDAQQQQQQNAAAAAQAANNDAAYAKLIGQASSRSGYLVQASEANPDALLNGGAGGGIDDANTSSFRPRYHTISGATASASNANLNNVLNAAVAAAANLGFAGAQQHQQQMNQLQQQPASNLLSSEELQNYLLRQAALKAQTLQQQTLQPAPQPTLNLSDLGISPQLAAELLNQQFLQMLAPGVDQTTLLDALRLANVQQLFHAAARQLYTNFATVNTVQSPVIAASHQPPPAQQQPPVAASQQLYLPLHNAVQPARPVAARHNAMPHSGIARPAATPPLRGVISTNDEAAAIIAQQQRRHSTMSAAAANAAAAQARAAAQRLNSTPVTISTRQAMETAVANYNGHASLGGVAPLGNNNGQLNGSSAGPKLSSPEEIQRHINQLITQNEAILEPSPILTKRRTYTRQLNGQPGSGGASGVANGGGASLVVPAMPGQQHNGNQQGGAMGLGSPREFRSNSMHAAASASSFSPLGSTNGGGSSASSRRHSVLAPPGTSWRPDYGTEISARRNAVAAIGSNTIIEEEPTAASSAARKFLAQVENETLRARVYPCRFCGLSVRHMDDLRRHEEKCAARRDMASQQTQLLSAGSGGVASGSNGGYRGAPPLKKRILAAAAEYDASSILTDGLPLPQVARQDSHSASLSTHQQSQQQLQSPKKHLTLPSVLVASSSNAMTTTIHQQQQQPFLVSYLEYLKVITTKDRNALNLPARQTGFAPTRECFETLMPEPCYTLYADNKASLYTNRSLVKTSQKESRYFAQLMASCELRCDYPLLRHSSAGQRSLMRVVHSTYSQYASDVKRSMALAALALQRQQQHAIAAAAPAPSASTSSDVDGVASGSDAGCGGVGDAQLVDAKNDDEASGSETTQQLDECGRRISMAETEPMTSPAETIPQSFSYPTTIIKKFASSNFFDDHRKDRYKYLSRYQLMAKRRARRIRAKKLAYQGAKETSVSKIRSSMNQNDEDSDETISNDGLCVVTDDEDDKSAETQGAGLITELGRTLRQFSLSWEKALKNNLRQPSPLLIVDDALAAAATDDDESLWLDADRSCSAPPYVDDECLPNHAAQRDPDQQRDSQLNQDGTKTQNGSDAATPLLTNSLGSTGIKALYAGDAAFEKTCELCGKRFRSFSLYALHQEAHLMERANAQHRRYEYRCLHCNAVARSRNQLQKHMAHAHPQLSAKQCQNAQLEILPNGGPLMSNRAANGGGSMPALINNYNNNNGSSSATLAPQVPAHLINDPRPFKCPFCDIAFRIHGHLAKHLRSKAHIMKLESLEKIPPGTFALLEEGNSEKFSQIDTSDCQNSLESLLRLVDELRGCPKASLGVATSAATNPLLVSPIQLSPTLKNGVVTSLVGISNAAARPSPRDDVIGVANYGPMMDAATSVSVAQSSISSLICTEQFRSAALSPLIPPGTLQQSLPSLLSMTSQGETPKRQKTVVADLWLPPKDIRASENVIFNRSPTTPNNISASLQSGATSLHRNSLPNIDSNISYSSLVNNSTSSPPSSVPDLPTVHQTAYACKFCDASFTSPVDLELHYHADHVLMRDGAFFKCPRPNCDTVYPTRQNLRNHLIMHYYGNLNGVTNQLGSQNGTSVVMLENSLCGDSSPIITNTNNNSKAMVAAALGRKLMNGTLEGFDTNSSMRKNHYCSRTSSTKSNCDCPKCAPSNSLDASPPSSSNVGAQSSDSDASRLSAGSRNMTPTPPLPRSTKRHHTVAGVDASMVKRQRSQASTPNVTPPVGSGVGIAASLGGATIKSLPTTVASQAALYSILNSSAAAAAAAINRSVSGSAASGASPAALLAATYNAAAAMGGAAQQQRDAFAALEAARSLYAGWPPATFNSGHPAAATAARSLTPSSQPNFASLMNGAGTYAAAAPHATGAVDASLHLQGPAMPITENVSPALPAEVFKCIKCGQCFSSATLVQEHLAEHFSERRSFVCEFCDAGFTSARGLAAHAPCRLQQQEIDVVNLPQSSAL